MEVTLNGANGPNVRQLAEVASNGSHELAPTRNQRVMEKLVRNSDLGLPSSPKDVKPRPAVSFLFLRVANLYVHP